MFMQIIQTGDASWKAKACLKKLKKTLNGFDYRIHFNDEGNPDAIIWMTLHMRKQLCQYSSILSLDSQNRQFNKLGWPYIAPAIKTANNKVGVTAESIVLVEDTAMYKCFYNQWLKLSLVGH